MVKQYGCKRKKQDLHCCAFCHEVLDLNYDYCVVEKGKYYHQKCHNKLKEQEQWKKEPFTINGHKISCAYCGEQIYLSEGRTFVCPPGEDFTTSLKCKWYHRIPRDCYAEWESQQTV
jgi:ribosomal protein L24E